MSEHSDEEFEQDNQNEFIPHQKAERYEIIRVHDKQLKVCSKSLGLFEVTNPIRYWASWIVESVYFENFILTIIILNTIFLATQDYSFRLQQDDPPQTWRDQADIIFTIVFIIEFLLKIISKGFFLEHHTYLRDWWNVIDFIVVISSAASFIVTTQTSSIRIVRLLRPLRSINKFQSMRVLVITLLDALPAIGDVIVFLAFIIILFGILGLQLFMGTLESRCRLTPEPIGQVWQAVPDFKKLCKDDSQCPTNTYCGNPLSKGLPYQDIEYEEFNYGYTNFDNILYATLSIFIALTTEGWTRIIFIFQEAESSFVVYTYFLVLIFVGAFFVVNLILAVINESFLESQGDDEVKQQHNIEVLTNHKTKVMLHLGSEQDIKTLASQPTHRGSRRSVTHFTTTGQLRRYQLKMVAFVEGKYCTFFITSVIILNTIVLALDRYPMSQNEINNLEIMNQIFTVIFLLEMLFKMFAYDLSYIRDPLNIFDSVIVLVSVVEWILESSGVARSSKSFSAIQAFRTLRLFRLFKLARTWVSFRKLLLTIASTVVGVTNFVVLLMLFMSIAALLGMELFAYKVNERYTYDTFPEAMLSVFLLLTNESWNTITFAYMHDLDSTTPVVYFVTVVILGNFILLKLFIAILIFNFSKATLEQKVNSEQDEEQEEEDDDNSQSNGSIEMQKSPPQSMLKTIKFFQQQLQGYKDEQQLEGKSLYLFDPTSTFRLKLYNLSKHKSFDNSVILVILISSLLLALDDPMSSQKNPFLLYLDIIITVIFTFEALVKIIVYGLILNGPGSYLRSASNCLDLIVIFFSAIVYLPSASRSFEKVKVLRVIRVLRPLKLIIKNDDLKMAINAMFNSIIQMINITMVCLIFFLLFGIFGVNQFKGAFFYCDIPAVDKWNCMDQGGNWINDFYNYDNIINAIITLFTIATTEGWVDQMSNGIDHVGLNQNPITNYNLYWAIYFVLFIIVGAFFILNLFAGVIVDAFGEERGKLSGHNNLKKIDQDWLEIQYKIYSSSPQLKFRKPKQAIMKILYNIVSSSEFDYIILICILLNTFVLMCQFSRQPEWVSLMIQYLNWFFLGVFTVEAAIKIIVYGNYYFENGWNTFDFTVVILTFVGVLLEETNLFGSFGSTTSMMRTFRVFRVLRLAKSAKQIINIFYTFLISLPGLISMGGLLLIMLFIFSVIFMNLFPYVKRGNGMSENVNFSSFGVSLFTLFKSTTGEDWNLVMANTAQSIQPNSWCYEISNYDDYLIYGMMGCGNWNGILIYIVFMVIVSIVMLNLFVAVIIEGHQNIKKEEFSLIQKKDIEEFERVWREFDRKATGFILCDQVTTFLCHIRSPLGVFIIFNIFLIKWLDAKFTRQQQRLKLYKYVIPVYIRNDKYYYFYYDILYHIALEYLESEKQYYGLNFKLEQMQRILELRNTVYKDVEPNVSEFDSSHYMAVKLVQKVTRKYLNARERTTQPMEIQFKSSEQF